MDQNLDPLLVNYLFKISYRREGPQYKKMIGIIEGHITRGQHSSTARVGPSGQNRREMIHEITVNFFINLSNF